MGTWLHVQLVALDRMQLKGETRFLTIKRGTSGRQLIADLSAEPTEPWVNLLWLKLHPELSQLKTGTYKIEQGWSLRQALALVASGKEFLFSVTLIEGSRIEDFVKTLHQAPYLTHTVQAADQHKIRDALDLKHDHIEGLFLPETYMYTAGTRDIDILKRAARAMDDCLQTQWMARADNLPYKEPYEALIMASIIEKETGIAAERPQIASVFINRLRAGMKLQTDPTVIYGVKDRYDGNITRADLQDQNPYNTYVINGLPPTPIAMPGKAAIQAALQPDSTDYLYFVAKGGGEHQFSRTLDEHNKAVRRYILGRNKP